MIKIQNPIHRDTHQRGKARYGYTHTHIIPCAETAAGGKGHTYITHT